MNDFLILLKIKLNKYFKGSIKSNMKYYILSESTDTDIIGYYPQTDVSEDSEFFSVFIDFQTRIEEFPEHIVYHNTK